MTVREKSLTGVFFGIVTAMFITLLVVSCIPQKNDTPVFRRDNMYVKGNIVGFYQCQVMKSHIRGLRKEGDKNLVLVLGPSFPQQTVDFNTTKARDEMFEMLNKVGYGY